MNVLRRAAGVRIGLGLGLAVVAALVSFKLATIVPYQYNMFWQIADGRAMLQGHFPTTVTYAIEAGRLVPQQWAYEAAIAWAAIHHAYGAFVVANAFAAAATPLLVYALVRSAGAGDAAAGVVALLTLGARFIGSAIRPETFAVDLFALELLLLTKPRSRWLIVPLAAVWANVHASVLLAPAAALLFACGEAAAQRSFTREARSIATIGVAAALATGLNPSGYVIWPYAIALALGSAELRAALDSWRPLFADGTGALLAVAPGIAVLAICGVPLRRDLGGWLALAAVWLALTVQHARYATFLCVAWAPLLAYSLQRRLQVVASVQARGPALAGIAALAIYSLTSLPSALAASADPPGPWRTAATIAIAHGLHGDAYVAYSWAAYLAARGLPLRMLIDAHGDPYPPGVWRDFRTLDTAAPAWPDVLRRRNITVILIPDDAALARAVASSAGWETVERRDGVAAFRRK